MKRILLATGLGLGILMVTMAGNANYATAPFTYNGNDTVPTDTTPTDTTSPTPAPDTTSHINH